MCGILPGVHALSGCATTSALYYIGMKTVYKVMEKSPYDHSNLYSFGSDGKVKVTKAARKFIANLYDAKGKEKRVHTDLHRLWVTLTTRRGLPAYHDSHYVETGLSGTRIGQGG